MPATSAERYVPTQLELSRRRESSCMVAGIVCAKRLGDKSPAGLLTALHHQDLAGAIQIARTHIARLHNLVDLDEQEEEALYLLEQWLQEFAYDAESITRR